MYSTDDSDENSTDDSDENITGNLSQVNGTYNVSDGDIEAELTRQDHDTIIATFSNGVGCTFTNICMYH